MGCERKTPSLKNIVSAPGTVNVMNCNVLVGAHSPAAGVGCGVELLPALVVSMITSRFT
jgi:hypothetical protein